MARLGSVGTMDALKQIVPEVQLGSDSSFLKRMNWKSDGRIIRDHVISQLEGNAVSFVSFQGANWRYATRPEKRIASYTVYIMKKMMQDAHA